MTSLDNAFSKFFECQAKAQSIVSNAQEKWKDSNKWLDDVLASAEALFKKPGPGIEKEEGKYNSEPDEDIVLLPQLLADQVARSARIMGKQRTQATNSSTRVLSCKKIRASTRTPTRLSRSIRIGRKSDGRFQDKEVQHSGEESSDEETVNEEELEDCQNVLDSSKTVETTEVSKSKAEIHSASEVPVEADICMKSYRKTKSGVQDHHNQEDTRKSVRKTESSNCVIEDLITLTNENQAIATSDPIISSTEGIPQKDKMKSVHKTIRSKSVAENQNSQIEEIQSPLLADPIIYPQAGNADDSQEKTIPREKIDSAKSARKTKTLNFVAEEQNTQKAESQAPLTLDTNVSSKDFNSEVCIEAVPKEKLYTKTDTKKPGRKTKSSKNAAEDHHTQTGESQASILLDPIHSSVNCNIEASEDDPVQKENKYTKKHVQKTKRSKCLTENENTQAIEIEIPVSLDTNISSRDCNEGILKEDSVQKEKLDTMSDAKKPVQKAKGSKSMVDDQTIKTGESQAPILLETMISPSDCNADGFKEETVPTEKLDTKTNTKKPVRKTKSLKCVVDDKTIKTGESQAPILLETMISPPDCNADGFKEETVPTEKLDTKTNAKKPVRKIKSLKCLAEDQDTQTGESQAHVLFETNISSQDCNADVSKEETDQEEKLDIKTNTKKFNQKTNCSKSLAEDQNSQTAENQDPVLLNPILSYQDFNAELSKKETTIPNKKPDTKKSVRKTQSSKCIEGDQSTRTNKSQASLSSVHSSEMEAVKVFDIPDAALTINIQETKTDKKKSVQIIKAAQDLTKDQPIHEESKLNTCTSNQIQSSQAKNEDKFVKPMQPVRASRAFSSVRQDSDHPESAAALDPAPVLAKKPRASRCNTRRTTQATTSITESVISIATAAKDAGVVKADALEHQALFQAADLDKIAVHQAPVEATDLVKKLSIVKTKVSKSHGTSKLNITSEESAVSGLVESIDTGLEPSVEMEFGKSGSFIELSKPNVPVKAEINLEEKISRASSVRSSRANARKQDQEDFKGPMTEATEAEKLSLFAAEKFSALSETGGEHTSSNDVNLEGSKPKQPRRTTRASKAFTVAPENADLSSTSAEISSKQIRQKILKELGCPSISSLISASKNFVANQANESSAFTVNPESGNTYQANQKSSDVDLPNVINSDKVTLEETLKEFESVKNVEFSNNVLPKKSKTSTAVNELLEVASHDGTFIVPAPNSVPNLPEVAIVVVGEPNVKTTFEELQAKVSVETGSAITLSQGTLSNVVTEAQKTTIPEVVAQPRLSRSTRSSKAMMERLKSLPDSPLQKQLRQSLSKKQPKNDKENRALSSKKSIGSDSNLSWVEIDTDSDNENLQDSPSQLDKSTNVDESTVTRYLPKTALSSYTEEIIHPTKPLRTWASNALKKPQSEPNGQEFQDEAVSMPCKLLDGTSKSSGRALAERPKNSDMTLDENARTPPSNKMFKSTNTSGMKQAFRARVPNESKFPSQSSFHPKSGLNSSSASSHKFKSRVFGNETCKTFTPASNKTISRTGFTPSGNTSMARSMLPGSSVKPSTPSSILNRSRTPANLVGQHSFLPSKAAKPKPLSQEELKQKKEEELRLKMEKMAQTRRRNEEIAKAKMEEKRLQREEKQRKVMEARKAIENESKQLHLNLERKQKEVEEMKRQNEEHSRKKRLELEESRKRQKEEEKRQKEEEEEQRKKRDEEERRKRQAEEEKRKQEEKENRKRQMEERREREEEEKENKKRQIEEKREREEEALRLRLQKQEEKESSRKVNLNETYDSNPASKLNSTYTKDEVSPPSVKAAVANKDNYDITDLKSDEDTDDDERPSKPVPTWAGGSELKTALLKLAFCPPDVDAIFAISENIDLSQVFSKKRPRFHKRTSSAQWDHAPTTHKYT